MLTIIDGILRAVLISMGILGYCFRCPEKFIAGRKMLTSIVVFYFFLALYLFFHALSNHTQNVVIISMTFIFEIIITFILGIGLYQIFKVWKFELENIKKILLYLSIVYLLGKTDPFDSIGKKILMELSVLPLVASIAVVVFTLLVIIKIRQIDTFIVFDRLEVVSVSYAIATLVGLCYIGKGVAFISCIVLIALDFYALFVIITFAKPIMHRL